MTTPEAATKKKLETIRQIATLEEQGFAISSFNLETGEITIRTNEPLVTELPEDAIGYITASEHDGRLMVNAIKAVRSKFNMGWADAKFYLEQKRQDHQEKVSASSIPQEAVALLEKKKMIGAIKAIRTYYGHDLKTAKDIAEQEFVRIHGHPWSPER